MIAKRKLDDQSSDLFTFLKSWSQDWLVQNCEHTHTHTPDRKKADLSDWKIVSVKSMKQKSKEMFEQGSQTKKWRQSRKSLQKL